MFAYLLNAQPKRKKNSQQDNETSGGGGGMSSQPGATGQRHNDNMMFPHSFARFASKVVTAVLELNSCNITSENEWMKEWVKYGYTLRVE